MRVQTDCYACILSQSVRLAKLASPNPEEQSRLIRRMLQKVLEADDRATPPEFAGQFNEIVSEVSGIDDPFREVKDQSTRLGLELLPELRELAEEQPDPFEAKVRMAIGGNIIDYGVNPEFNLLEAEAGIREVFDLPFDRTACADLKRRMDRAKRIFYMLDNCGEAVVDRLLMEPYADKLVIGVRGKPVLNDVTRREAMLSGIDFAPVLDTGDRAPGVSLRRSSPEILDALHSADLVISKGQGNFESLDEDFRGPVYFLLRIKCKVIAERLRQPLGSIQILGRNLHAETR